MKASLRALALAGLGAFFFTNASAATSFPEGTVVVRKFSQASAVQGLLHLELKPGWHVYWLHPGDAGYPPLLRIGTDTARLSFPLPKRFDLGGDVLSLAYEDSVTFPVTAKMWNQGDSLIVKFLVCKEACLPRKLVLAPESVDTIGLGVLLGRLPTVGALHPVARLSGTRKSAQLWVGFPGAKSTQGELYVAPSPEWRAGQALASRTNGDTLWLGVAATSLADSLPDTARFLAAARIGAVRWQDSLRATWGSAPPVTAPKGTGTLWIALLLGLVGGLILNLMPCVLPVLALKALSLTRLSIKESKVARLSGLATAGGILTGLLLLATTVVALKATGITAGWGAQFQEPGYVAFLTVLMVIFGVNLMGLFEFRVPGVALSHHHSMWVGEFLQGLLAVALSTPCSAPVLGSAVGVALSQPTYGIYAIFLSIGIGLAAPYLLLAAVPKLAKLLPRPGEWMETLRRILSLPMFATALWLLWVLGSQMERGAHLRFQFVLLGIAALAGALGWAQCSMRRGAERALAIVLILAIGGAVWMSQFREAASKVTWMAFSPARLDSLRAAGKPVLVDGTADWCLSCKVNKARVLRDAQVEAVFAASKLVVLEADWTRRDSVFGNWMAGYGRQAVPFNLLVLPGKEPILLPELLSKGMVTDPLREVKGR
jgi:suppressor for copper-sensitivity B